MDEDRHLCKEMKEATDSHSDGFNGGAVEEIHKNTAGKWVATQTHYEYGSYIKFCPYCGLQLDRETTVFTGSSRRAILPIA